jgi:hypothetical protein
VSLLLLHACYFLFAEVFNFALIILQGAKVLNIGGRVDIEKQAMVAEARLVEISCEAILKP